MMSTTAVIGLSAGKRLLSTSFFGYDLNDKFSLASDHGLTNHQHAPTKNVITAKSSSNYNPSFSSTNRQKQSVNALKQCLDTASTPSTTDQPWPEISDDTEDEDSEVESSVDALLLLQKSMLEKQWNLSAEQKTQKKMSVVCSGTSARQRRISSKTKVMGMQTSTSKQPRSLISPELMRNKKRFKGYAKGSVSKQYLSHAEVVCLSKKVQAGISLDKHKLRLQEKLGYEPSDKELAMSLKISHAELQAKVIECNLARQKLAMSNVRLVISIAKNYEDVGAEMADIVQGGMVGLLRGIEKFDPSKGFKMSTYVYWWIRQGISKALVDCPKFYRIPAQMSARIGLVREAKARLEQKGVTPSIANIAQYLNLTEKKVSNATKAMQRVLSLDREAYPNLNGIPGDTHLSLIADTNPDNDPWLVFQKWALKEEINKILNIALGEREREIVTLYYGLQGQSLTWEEISKRLGLSRERVRQIGLVAMEKVKRVARKKKLDAMVGRHEY